MATTEPDKYATGGIVENPPTVGEDGCSLALPTRTADLENRLRLAHQARRAKEHQLDGIRRALCDAGFMEDDDPYNHADLADVIRQVGQANAEQREAELNAALAQQEATAIRIEDRVVATVQQRTTDALAAELHRRNQRLSDLASDPSTCNSEAWACVRGEVLGLQLALGIALGHPATGDEGLKAARAYYIQWLGQATDEPGEPRPPAVGR